MSDKVKPITPSEAAREQTKVMPDAVIQVFNQLIVAHYLNGLASFSQDEVVFLLIGRGFSRQQIFHEGLLNIGEIYRSAGWEVVYDIPAYNESYPATFKFKRS